MKINLIKRIKQKTLIRDVLSKLGFSDYRILYKNLFFKYLDYISVSKNTVRMGSEYGFWMFIDSHKLNKATYISAGVGEDISFDVEFLSKYKGKAIFVDPTPKALEHLRKVIDNLGSSKKQDYIAGGFQPIDAYELSEINVDQIIIENYALFDSSDKVLDFYPPKESDHVSHSISNLQKISKKNPEIFKVKTTTVKDLMNKHNIEKLSLIKLDIEGAAEDHVIPNLIKDKIFPDQILVEFDNLYFKGLISYLKAALLIRKLLLKNYNLLKTDYLHGLLFVKNS
tara:strand:+ start:247 stop:1095 length:849 start_codon:yes stop_codon:yes gene_type:complete